MYRGGLSKNVAIQCKPGGHCSLPCETLDRQHVRCGVAKGCRRAPVLQVMQSTGRKGQPSQIWQPVFVSKSGAVTHLSEGTQGSGTHPYKKETFRLNIEIKGLLFHFTYNSWDVFFFFSSAHIKCRPWKKSNLIEGCFQLYNKLLVIWHNVPSLETVWDEIAPNWIT